MARSASFGQETESDGLLEFILLAIGRGGSSPC